MGYGLWVIHYPEGIFSWGCQLSSKVRSDKKRPRPAIEYAGTSVIAGNSKRLAFNILVNYRSTMNVGKGVALLRDYEFGKRGK